ncbi:hypothetical protein D9Q98_000703 [Chlorella vulgaris]|uniref:Uncharacterized protein n=1 Tax=Chlorella vulgaris TaxID=3077 RepID=A0A9D4TYS8_CHLVU|nr:hypothetical protein D9Q98_000703 [Chlorella vulgaris]
MVLALQSSACREADATALVPFADSEVGEPMEQKLARLRGNRVAHSRKQIWTKDAHGGPYKKVNIDQGLDPLIQHPDGSNRKVDLGYERVKVGPTSNFVGNHMTQGAIDLVQAQLELPSAQGLLLLSAGGAQPPQLLPHTSGDEQRHAATTVQYRPLHRYSWTDEGDSIMLKLPVQQLRQGSSTGSVLLTCSFAEGALDLRLEPVDSQGAEVSGSSASRPTPYRLLVRPLRAAVVPGSCSCHVSGVLSLPPCESGASKHGGSRMQQNMGGQQLHRMSLALPPSADAVVVQLAKADASLQWDVLHGSLQVAARQAEGHAVDLAALRRTVRQQLNRAAPTPPVAAEAQVLEAQVSQGNAGAVQSSEAAADWALQLQAALKQAQTLVAVGRYSEALDASEACINALPLLLSPPQRGPAVQLHALRGHSHGQLGGVKQAVIEYSAAIKLAQEGGEWSDEQQQESVDGNGLPSLCQLLLARSAQYEQQERLEDALKDVLQAIKLQQQPVPSLLLAAQRLRAQQAVSTPRL